MKKNKIIPFLQHPYLVTLFLWFAALMTTAVFQVDTVLGINYLSAFLFVGIAAFAITQKKKKARKAVEPKNKNLNLIQILAIFAAVIYFFIMMRTFAAVPTDDMLEGRNVFVIFAFLAAAVISYIVLCSVKKKWCYQRVLNTILLISFVIYLFYILYTNLAVRQFNLGILSEYDGHIGYTMYIYNSGNVPQIDPTTYSQYYHPPLYYIIEAIFLRIQTTFGVPLLIALQNCQFTSLLYAMITIVTVYRILVELGVRKTALCVSVAVAAFSPALICMSGTINNDMLSVMFMVLTFLAAVKWYKEQRAKNILKVALFFGLGMFTKLSVCVVAVPVAVIFITALVKKIIAKDKKQSLGLFGQMCAFLGVAAPLSLYWSIRNLVRFGIPIGYVAEPVVTQNGNSQLITTPVWQRLFDFNPNQFAYPFTANPLTNANANYAEYNPLVALLKSASIGMGVNESEMLIPAYFLLWSGIIVAVVSFICMIAVLVKKNSIPVIWKGVLGSFYVAVMVSYYVFCIAYPYVCTEEIRYAIPVIFIGAIFIGLALNNVFTGKTRISKIMRYITIISVILFCVISLVYFIWLGYYSSIYINFQS
ncbi:MAG: glycosyltransferase family 39 protein [Clostridia bacterium]|nr:glycosyltransferase family 39 protein [Clostridia bacterium]